MKKTLFMITIVLSLMLVSCASPISDPTTDSPESTGPVLTTETAGSAETTYSVHQLRGLITQYQSEGDNLSVYETAKELLERDPSDTDAYLAAVDALVSLSKSNYQEINRLLALGSEKAQDTQALADWAKQNQPDYSITLPFIPDYSSADEINTDGIAAGNLTNAAKYNGWWLGGLLTWQGDWVYLARPDQEFAIYKMRADGSDYQRIGAEKGSSLNVIGDWFYYINHDDGSKLYKMRTDGSMKTKLSDDESAFLSVSGDWLFYHNGSDNGCLYRMKTDGSVKEKLVDKTVMFPCVADGWVYYTEKSESSNLFRIPAGGGKPAVVIDSGSQPYVYTDENGQESRVDLTTDFVNTYCVWNDWVYFFDQNNPYSVRRVHTDGSGYELVWPFDFHMTTLNIVDGSLACSFYDHLQYEEDGFYIGEEIVTLDLESLEKQLHLMADTEPICTGPDGWVYYFKYSDGLAWYAMDMDGKEHKIG